ncbi:MAG: M23 family metallopeptidase [Firmicutes bacterium]|nr:M23 family metallopeptidase [Bacillota bacterium]
MLERSPLKLTWPYNDGQLPLPSSWSRVWPKHWLKNKQIVRSLICGGIFVLVLAFSRLDYSWARPVQAGIAYAFSADYDLTPWLQRLSQTMLWESDSERPVFSIQAKAKSTMVKQPMIYPVAAGKISREFGWYVSTIDNQQRFHEGIDIDTSLGKPVRAVLAGEVIKVGEDKNLGRLVQLDHGQNVFTLYAHCQEILVKPGDRVAQGDIIAKVGQTGAVDRPQLHFEMRIDGRLIDPLAQLRGSATK